MDVEGLGGRVPDCLWGRVSGRNRSPWITPTRNHPFFPPLCCVNNKLIMPPAPFPCFFSLLTPPPPPPFYSALPPLHTQLIEHVVGYTPSFDKGLSLLSACCSTKGMRRPCAVAVLELLVFREVRGACPLGVRSAAVVVCGFCRSLVLVLLLLVLLLLPMVQLLPVLLSLLML